MRLKIASPAGEPDEFVIDLGRQALTPTPLPVLALDDFAVNAAASAGAIVAGLPPGPLKEMDLTLRLPLLQMLIQLPRQHRQM